MKRVLDLLWETYIENRDLMSDVQLAALIYDAHTKLCVIPKIESSIGGELNGSEMASTSRLFTE